MGRFVGVLKLGAGWQIAVVVIVRMAMVVLPELFTITVCVAVVGKREREVELVRLRDVGRRFEKPFLFDKRESLPGAIGSDGFNDDRRRVWQESFAMLGKRQPKHRRDADLKAPKARPCRDRC